MERENVIVLNQGQKTEVYGSLTEACRVHKDWAAYNTLKLKSFPFEHKGVRFSKLKYRTKYNIKPEIKKEK